MIETEIYRPITNDERNDLRIPSFHPLNKKGTSARMKLLSLKPNSVYNRGKLLPKFRSKYFI